MGEVIQFPSGEAAVVGKKCKVCGFVIVRTREEIQSGAEDRDLCFCCAHTIPLPLAVPEKWCQECDGYGVVSVHVCENERDCAKKCPQPQTCAACGGTGRRG